MFSIFSERGKNYSLSESGKSKNSERMQHTFMVRNPVKVSDMYRYE